MWISAYCPSHYVAATPLKRNLAAGETVLVSRRKKRVNLLKVTCAHGNVLEAHHPIITFSTQWGRQQLGSS